ETDAIEPFSSLGPTNDGRVKPDLVAPDGVTNSIYGSFYGTSSSAPHAAGAAACILQENPSSPDEIKDLLERNCIELGALRKDNTYGSGRIDLYQSTMDSLGLISYLEYAVGKNPVNIHLSYQSDDVAHRMTVSWKTTDDASSVVYYDTVSRGGNYYDYTYSETGLTHNDPDVPDAYHHDVEITDLSPDTVYYYICGETDNWSPEKSFTTGPSTSSETRFMITGDCYSYYDVRDDLSASMAARNPDFILTSGDYVTWWDSHWLWDSFLNHIDNIWVTPGGHSIPIILGIGNHDVIDSSFAFYDYSSWFERFALPGNEEWYSLDWGPDIHIIVLNTERSGEITQTQWLEDDLIAHEDYLWKIVLFHQNVVPAWHAINTPALNDWVPLFDLYNVDIVIHGHNHYYTRSEPLVDATTIMSDYDEGILYLISAGWGSPLYPPVDDTWVASYAQEYHYVQADSYLNGSLRLKSINEYETVIDQVWLYKNVNSNPVVSNPIPLDSATDVPITTTSIGFTLTDPDGDLMDYTVTTNPPIGSGSANNVGDGTYSISVSGLEYSTTYTWTVTADDDITSPTVEVFSFTSESEVNPDAIMFVYENTLPFSIKGSTMTSDGTFYIVGSSNTIIYKSTDNCETWHYVSDTPRSAGYRDMYCTSQDTLLLADEGNPGQVHRSTNNGMSWSTVLTLGSNEVIWSFDEYDGKVYASVYSMWDGSLGHAKVMVSSDDGATWSLLVQFSSIYRHAHGLFVNKYNGWIYVVLGDGQHGLMRSKNGGATWTNLHSNYLFTSINAYPDSNIIYLGRDGYPAIYRAIDDGGDSISLTAVYDNGSGDHSQWEKENVFWMRVVNGRLVFGEVVDTTEYPAVLGVSNLDWMSFTKVREKYPSEGWKGFPMATCSYWPIRTLVAKCDVESGDRSVIISWNDQPAVSSPNPVDGAIDISVSITSLGFTIGDLDSDLMDYTVTTSPDVGSGSENNVIDGTYSIPVSGLAYSTLYSWTVTVDDGVTEPTVKTYSFTTEEDATPNPVVSDPNPISGANDVSISITSLEFTISDPNGDPMDYSVLTSPDIGVGSDIGVSDGTYSVSVSGLAYSTLYSWTVTVDDGITSPTVETYSFTTENAPQPPVVSNPSPLDGAVDVQVSTTNLEFTITDADGDLMDAQVQEMMLLMVSTVSLYLV
ncbi:MAG: fibronectin type III domain-containing protein, partial [Candidatus Thorarchaeota archaeon]